MTGKQRILAALELKQPDTVPVWELAFNESSIIGIAGNFMDASELPEDKLFVDMDEMEQFQLINAFKTMCAELDIDGLFTTTNIPIERVDADYIRDANGVVFHCSEHGEPYPVQGPIGDAQDLQTYKMRTPQEEDFFLITFARSQFEDKAISYMMSGPFFLSWSLRGGMENLLMDFVLNPNLAQRLARMATDYCLECLDLIAAKGADFVVFECDLAFKNGTIMSKAHYEQFIGPYHKEIVDHAHHLGLKAVKHSDGVLHAFIPYFIEEGFDGLHPIQPQCMDIAEIKKEYGDRICIMGNIDCAFLLPFGNPEQVRESVRDTIAAAGAGGGYIISSSNTIHPGVKPENYIALVKAAREFGKY